MKKLNIENLTIKYSKLNNPTLKEINLEILANEKVLIVGPSGSGKSTLGKFMNGLIPNAYKAQISGQYTIDEEHIQKKSIFEMSNYISTIMQDQDSQFVGLTVGQDVAFVDENNCVERSKMLETVKRNLEHLEISDLIDVEPKMLSGGQKQRVSLAGLLTSDAPILLFDEPLANLDPLSCDQVLALINDIHERFKKTTIVIEHRLEEVIHYNYDRIILINDDQILYNGKVDELLKSDLLPQNNIRKPLYLELLDKCEVPYEKYTGLHNLDFIDEQLIEHVRAKLKENPSSESSETNLKTVLEFENINFSYVQNKQILKDISFEVLDNSITTILGNNGSGKTTILNLIIGILKVQTGEIKLENELLNEMSIFKRGQKIAYVMQNPNHAITHDTVYEEVKSNGLRLQLTEAELEQKITNILEVCNLSKYRKWPINMLSYGQKRRVTIATALITDPQVILLDEPTSGQDYRTFKSIMELLKKLAKNGLAIVIITHNMQLALEYSDKTIVLDHGEVRTRGITHQVFKEIEKYESAKINKPSVLTVADKYNLDYESILAKLAESPIETEVK